jgi:hypothetical protein
MVSKNVVEVSDSVHSLEGTAYSKTVIFWLSELYCVLLKVTFIDCTNIVSLFTN